MKLKNRDVGFFLFGGFVFLLGSLFTPFQEERANAQPPFQEGIRCGRLEILDEIGHPVLVLDTNGEGGGVVNVFGKGGWASLSANKHGGDVVVAGESGEGRLTVDKNGARFSVKGDAKSEAGLSIDEQGNGVLRILDKQGNETGSVP